MEIVVGIVFLLVGSAILLGALLLISRSIRRLRNWTTTTGTVIEYIESGTAERKPAYLPKVRFLSHTGQTVVFTNESGSSRKPYRIGDELKVIYDPDEIQSAIIKSISSLWLVPGFAVFFGGTFSTLGVDLLFFTKH